MLRESEADNGSEGSTEGMRARIVTICNGCGSHIQKGQLMWPLRHEPDLSSHKRNAMIYMHISCARQRNGRTLPERPVCKHWLEKGACYYLDNRACFYRHPPEVRGCDILIGAVSAQPGMCAPKCGCPTHTRTHKRRAASKSSSSRSKALCHFVATHLPSAVHGGCVLDVAAGKGELGFLLANLHGARVALMEPRSPDTSKALKLLRKGVYHQSILHCAHMPPEHRDWAASEVRMPSHFPIALTRSLAAAAVGVWRDIRREGGEGSAAERAGERAGKGRGAVAEKAVDVLEKAVFEAWRETLSSDWSYTEHERCGNGQERCGGEQDICGGEQDICGGGQDGCGCEQERCGSGRLGTKEESAGSDFRGVQSGSESGEEKNVGSEEGRVSRGDDTVALRKERGQIRPGGLDERIVSDVACHLLDATLVVAMHPDQATEPAVDMALGMRKAFAVVPCCVFPRESPDRAMKSGARVRSYGEFIEYLMEKHPGIRKADLGFVGQNQVLYWDPLWETP